MPFNADDTQLVNKAIDDMQADEGLTDENIRNTTAIIQVQSKF